MSGKKPRPPWHAEAIRMRSASPHPTISEIAAMLGQKVDAVRYALNENGERDRCLAKDKRRAREERAARPSIGKRGPQIKSETHMTAPHKPRAVAKVLADPEVKSQALKDFAAGKIARDELMRRIVR